MKPYGISKVVKSSDTAIISGNANANINGLLLPHLVIAWSEIYPITGLKSEFHTAPMAVIVPATAGARPATVVKKNIRNVPINIYAAESPSAAKLYPVFSLKFNLSIQI